MARELAKARRVLAPEDAARPLVSALDKQPALEQKNVETANLRVESDGDDAGAQSIAVGSDVANEETGAATEHVEQSAVYSSVDAALNVDSSSEVSESSTSIVFGNGSVSDASENSSVGVGLDVYSLADGMNDFFSMSTHPTEFLRHENFIKGVEILQGSGFPRHMLLALYQQDFGGTYTIQACMALEALARRKVADDAVKPLLDFINIVYYYTRYFALRALHACARGPVVVEFLLRADSSWADGNPLRYLREFVAWRVESGEVMTFGERLATLTDEQANTLSTIFGELKDVLPETLQSEFRDWQKERVDFDFLKTFGRIWEHDASAVDDVVLLDAVMHSVAQLETAMRKEPPRSVLLVGERGVGKTTLLRLLAQRLQKERWTIFEATAADVMAGQQYIGQLEGRVQSLVRQIGGKRVLWVVPNFHELLWAGRHTHNPTGLLDYLLPHIENGQVKIVGETTSVAFEKLVQVKPQLRTVLEACRVLPMPDAETLELAREWARRRGESGADAPRINEQTLQEAFQLAKQYLADKAAPGNLLQFVDSTHRRLVTEQGASRGEISLDDLLVTLSQLTGLPVTMLDERAGLDLRELQQFFHERVLGQPEAVDCLVERVAMIKAGLTDPTRPQGVFLFVGPTGTGKTEIAKTLAEFLFGSPERMIRLDMSEFQTADSLDRILGETSETGDSTALVNAIRKQPFSVVLLDEFEKANASVWDLFLQVFDDGRLTDRRGNTADFRHCVVIMTSNLGATLPHGVGIGFSQEQAGFAPASVERAVTRAFRREFINRIDRVVVFRPLGRNVMRDLLRKELNDVLRRRGLRTRSWAVEWDESAIDFLLHKGFTPDLGARPLKRAIERYLLSPLAITIVNHQFPEGDQFLFVRSNNGEQLDVAFIDPDAPEPTDGDEATRDALRRDTGAHESSAAAEAEAEALRLESIALDAKGTPAEVEFLEERFRRLETQTCADEWRGRKADAFTEIAAPDFWESPQRFSVLGTAEYMDRIETGLDTAGSLLNRLTGSRSAREPRKHFPRDLVARLAEQLYLIDSACAGLANGQPRDAFVVVRATRDAHTDASASDEFAARIARMYRQWAQKRRMSFEVLTETGGSGDAANPYQMLLAVSGFAAYTILEAETGLHVLEMPQDEKAFGRARVQVHVVAQPDEPPSGHTPAAFRMQATRAFSTAAADGNHTAQLTTIVRRYREEPSPLVRDRVRGWRTGKLERVLDGDFDLM
jgi:ATP-dependent Clp protease ATP-binding subunit ClpC